MHCSVVLFSAVQTTQGTTVFFLGRLFADRKLAAPGVGIEDRTIVEFRIATKDRWLKSVAVAAFVGQDPLRSTHMTHPLIERRSDVVGILALVRSFKIAHPVDPADGSIANKVPRRIGVFVTDFQPEFSPQGVRYIVVVAILCAYYFFHFTRHSL